MEEIQVYKSKAGGIFYTKEACYEDDVKYDLEKFLNSNINSDKYLDYKKVFFDLIDPDNELFFNEIINIIKAYYEKLA